MSNAVLVNEEYVLLIDTDSYAENFADQLCAYCTGLDSEENPCVDEINAFRDELQCASDVDNPFFGMVGDRQNDNGAWCPSAVWLNPKYGMDATGKFALLTEQNYDLYNFPAPLSVGIYFDERPTMEQIEIIKERAAKYFKEVYKEKTVTVEGFRLLKHTKYAEELPI